MSFTKRTTLADTGWTALTSAGSTGVVQIQGNGAAKLHLGQSLPAADSMDYVTIWDDGLAEFPFLHAETGDTLYGQSLYGDIEVSVVATGTAPA